ncbi:helix-turn-helix transcriptional regulator [Vallitaleaceae bacterium 9-2]
MDKEINHIIRRIKDSREALGYSYQDLAEKTGLSKSTLQRYETGAIKNIPIQKLEILAEALEVTPNYLMGWEDEPNDDIHTIAAHHNDEKWTDEELQEIEAFKEFVKSKRKK